MLEIFLVIYLSRRIKNTLAPKGYRAGIWQFWTFMVWYGLEFIGAFVSMYLGSETIIALISGVLCAVGGSIALQKYAQSLPDISSNADQWIDNIGKEDGFK